MTATVDPVLREQCLRYFLSRRHLVAPELECHEAEFPGVSLAPPPWSDHSIRYQTIANVSPGVGARAPARRRLLIATIGGGTFAMYSTVLQIWSVLIAERRTGRRP